MCDFTQKLQVEDLFDKDDVLFMNAIGARGDQYGVNLNGEELHLVLTPTTIMEVKMVNGKMAGMVGRSAKVEQLELDTVRITFPNGRERYQELGDGVYWLPEKEVH